MKIKLPTHRFNGLSFDGFYDTRIELENLIEFGCKIWRITK